MIVEHGRKGLESIKCDLYSCEIMLRETFTRTKHNDDMFDGDLSLKQLVCSCRCQLITPQDE